MSIIKIKGTVSSLSPITHFSDKPDEGVIAKGNQTFQRKIKVFYEGNVVYVPVISGNSIRGIMRRLGAKKYLELLGLRKEEIPQKLYYLLFSGGSLEENKKEEAEIKATISELRQYIPLISLLGASFTNKILDGKLLVDFLVPKVDEIAEIYNFEKPGLSARMITDWTHYTRKDDLQKEETKEEKETTTQMIYNIEYIIPNIDFIHEFTLQGANEIEQSLLADLIHELQKYGHLGGKIAQGHGKVKFNYNLGSLSPEEYLHYIEKNKDSILNFLKTNWNF